MTNYGVIMFEVGLIGTCLCFTGILWTINKRFNYIEYQLDNMTTVLENINTSIEDAKIPEEEDESTSSTAQ